MELKIMLPSRQNAQAISDQKGEFQLLFPSLTKEQNELLLALCKKHSVIKKEYKNFAENDGKQFADKNNFYLASRQENLNNGLISLTTQQMEQEKKWINDKELIKLIVQDLKKINSDENLAQMLLKDEFNQELMALGDNYVAALEPSRKTDVELSILSDSFDKKLTFLRKKIKALEDEVSLCQKEDLTNKIQNMKNARKNKK